MNELLSRIINESKPLFTNGKLPTYIPELSNAEPDNCGAALLTLDGELYRAGDFECKFTIQSISKIVSLALAILELEEVKLFESVGLEPSADSFNSIIGLELNKNNRPYNPVVNSGAILVISLLPYKDKNRRFERILSLARDLTGNKDLTVNEAVYLSEKTTGDRNRSIAYFMKSTGVLEGKVEDILETYFRQCSIEATVQDLAVMGATFASGGLNPFTGKQTLPSRACDIILSLMTTCGMYDGSGEFAIRVGIPAKSGVGGGIVASVPKRMGIGVYGPSLDSKGNSVCSMAILEHLSAEMHLRVY